MIAVSIYDIFQLLRRLTDLCEQKDKEGKAVKHQKHEQRLLKNLGAHQAVLDLLAVPHDEVEIESTDGQNSLID